jgi:hypothetical protein
LRLRLLLISSLLLILGAVPAAASATSIRWHSGIRLEPVRDGGLNAVSCPSTTLCVAVDESGNVVTTTNPLGGGWTRPVRIDTFGGGLTAVSCPTSRFCVAGDANGNVLTSTDPTGGSRAWSRPVKVDSVLSIDGGPAGIDGLSCPSVKLCVATDGATPADVIVSTRPAAGARAWTTTKLTGTLDAVSCTYNTTDCVVVGSEHWWTTTAVGGAPAWHDSGAAADNDLMAAIACPSLAMCAAAGYGDGSPSETTGTVTPRAAASAWTTVPVADDPPAPGDGLLDAIGCASAHFCVAVDSLDNAWTSTTPAVGGWTGGRPIRPRSAAQATAISCNPRLCAVVDSAGVETTGTVRP